MTLRPLWLTETYPPDRGGMAQSCDRIVHALRERRVEIDVEIDVAHVSRRYDRWHVETKNGGRQICCPADDDPAHTLNLLWNIVRRGETPTHVVAFGGTLPLLAGPLFAAWLQVPLVTLIRGNDFDAAVFSPKKSDVLRHALRSSAAICTVTRDHATRIAALNPAVEPVWVPNGIDVERWQILPHDRIEGERHRVPGRRTLGMFGQLKQKKGLRFFLDALEQSGVAERFHLLLVGDVDPSLGVEALPFRDRLDLLPLYAACDLVAVPSFYDGLPNVVLEAAALGIPLLASDAGGMADLLVDGENSIRFDAGDSHDCRRAIMTAATIDDDSLRAFGARAQSAVALHFNVEKEAQSYVEVLRSCTADRRLRAAR